MILVMRNEVDEFVPGHDWTVVRLDAALVGRIAARARACRAMREADLSLAEARYGDDAAECVASPDPDTEDSIERALERGDGWAVLEDDALGGYEEADADCAHMVVTAGDSPAVSWAYRVGSEPVRTAGVPLAGLAARLGSPLGDPLDMVP